MLRLTCSFPPVLMLLVAGCATAPSETPGPLPPPVQAAPARPEPRDLVALDSREVGERFGTPALTVREGDGTRVQYRAGESCVLDLFLYPGVGGGVPRVAHVETRNRQGRPVDRAACVAALERR